ncbi:MAG: GAF domain-containing protein [Planctomycetes bacterium]|nr:GAF domain-containing protein [Planctomycetota bacterium]
MSADLVGASEPPAGAPRASGFAAAAQAVDQLLDRLPAGEREPVAREIGATLRAAFALSQLPRRLGGASTLALLLPRLATLVSELLEAERCTFFLLDRETDELCIWATTNAEVQGLRMPHDRGIAGWVLTSGTPLLLDDVYSDPRFNPDVDRMTGFRTRSMACAPIRRAGLHGAPEPLGVAQVLNKRSGAFSPADLHLLQAVLAQAAADLVNAQLEEAVRRVRDEERRLLDANAALARELSLDPLLIKIMEAARTILDSEKATFFLHDAPRGELWTRASLDASMKEVRFPADRGIAGSVFTDGQSVNIRDAYADPRFNQAVDRQTGYRTRTILCVPVANREGRRIGVLQALNKRGRFFTAADEELLRAFGMQAAVAIENAQLFEEVVRGKSYTESVLASLSNGVITLDQAGLIVTANRAALRLTRLEGQEAEVLGRPLAEVFSGGNAWLAASADAVRASGKPQVALDAELTFDWVPEVPGGTRSRRHASVNLTAVPLTDAHEQRIGGLVVLEDITREKRVRATIARYMPKDIADRLMEEGEDALGGRVQEATVLFSDIRGFTRLAERLGPQETVRLLNQYFTLMVDVILGCRGALDKYIGDALLAVFGVPYGSPQDAEHAVQAALGMVRALREFNRRRAAAGQAPLETGIGIHTDQVVSGNIGSLKRMEYTVVGDGVNLASRLEGATKPYHTPILISEHTRARLTGIYRMREIDLLRVVGRRQPVAVFEVLDPGVDEEVPRLEEALAAYAEALAGYRRREWSAAAAGFAAVLRFRPEDGPSRVYARRCERFAAAPPPPDWDGVWDLTDK